MLPELKSLPSDVTILQQIDGNPLQMSRCTQVALKKDSMPALVTIERGCNGYDLPSWAHTVSERENFALGCVCGCTRFVLRRANDDGFGFHHGAERAGTDSTRR